MIEGIDISFWDVMVRSNDGKSLVYVADFEKTRKQANIRFLYWKATQGSNIALYKGAFTDPAYERIEQDTRNWVPRGCFHFFAGDVDGKNQIMRYLDVVSNAKLNLPDMIDVEYNGNATYKQTALQLEKGIRTIHDQTRRFPLIYTADWFWRWMPVVDGADQCELAVANYTTGPTPFLPRNGPWKAARLWQWIVTKNVDGLIGGVDQDRFIGTEADFQRFIISWSPPPSTEFPKKAMCIINSLWVRDMPGGNGIGGLRYGDVVNVYKLFVDSNVMTWARISPDGSAEKWCAMKITRPSAMDYMRFI